MAAVVLLSAVVGVAALGSAASTSSSNTTGHDNGIGANYTVVLPNEQSHQPGASGADIHHLAAANGIFEDTSSPKGLETWDTLTIWSQDVNFGSCSTSNTQAFGLDRGNDNSGTQTDEGLLAHRQDSSFNQHSIYVSFFTGEGLSGEPISLKAEDQIVAVQTGCYGMPSEPGWYQINARVNGTGYNGNYIDSKNQGTIRSHYFYVCDCSSRQEAEQKLGPPPGQGSGGSSGGGSGGGGSTPTATATPTSGGGSGGGGSTPTATATPTSGGGSGGNGSTQTATATPTSGGSNASTSGNNTTSGGSTNASSNTSTNTTSANTSGNASTGGSNTSSNASTGGSNTSGNASTGGSNGSSTGGNGSSGDVVTPTSSGSGPGFGLLAAFAALAGAALLGLRRRD